MQTRIISCWLSSLLYRSAFETRPSFVFNSKFFGLPQRHRTVTDDDVIGIQLSHAAEICQIESVENRLVGTWRKIEKKILFKILKILIFFFYFTRHGRESSIEKKKKKLLLSGHFGTFFILTRHGLSIQSGMNLITLAPDEREAHQGPILDDGLSPCYDPMCALRLLAVLSMRTIAVHLLRS